MSFKSYGLNTEDNNLINVGECLYVKKRSVFNIFLNVIIAVFCIILIAELLFNTFFTGIYVINVSMRPNFIGAERDDKPGGDFIYVNTFAKPDYGDVVVVYREEVNIYGEVERGNIIKRVLAFGGDTVRIDGGVLYVNDEIVVEDYVAVENNDPKLNNFESHVVAENCMFLLGDNRNMSSDSREKGDYSMDNLVGVVPQWSIAMKPVTTAIYTFFHFTIYGK